MSTHSIPIRTCLETGSTCPWVYGYAAELEGEDVHALRNDPGVIDRALSGAAELFGLPAVTPSFDPTLEADAMGCAVSPEMGVESGCITTLDDALDISVEHTLDHPRIETVLDGTERLTATLSESSVLGSLSGPGHLVSAVIAGTDAEAEAVEEAWFVASDVQVALANAYLDRGCDGLLLLEPEGFTEIAEYKDAIMPLVNVVDHFDGTTIAMTGAVRPDDLRAAGSFGIDAVAGRLDNPDRLLDVATEQGVTLGASVPDGVLLEGSAAEYIAGLPDAVFPTSEWAVPQGVPPEHLHAMMEAH